MPSMRLRRTHPALRSTGILACCALVWLGAPVRAAHAGRSDSPAIRVLLYAGPGPIGIESGGRKTTFEATPDGVRRGGHEVRTTWTLPAHADTRVGTRSVHGALRVARDPASTRGGEPRLMVINSVDLEDYVAGVLAGEIPASWQPEALAAQAVASRSYALHERDRRRAADWDVTATTSHQVYAETEQVDAAIRRAVDRTRGEVLTFHGRPILAAFHSASGGRTASAAEVWGRSIPYLVSRDVPGEEDSPDTYWRAGVTLETFGRLLTSAGRGVGRPESVTVTERTESGRVARVEVRGSRGRVEMSGKDLRAIVGESTLRSTLFDLRPDPDRVIFVGTGRGHGVGMSQWAAQAMARDGRPYAEILETFYPGTRVEHMSRTAAASP